MFTVEVIWNYCTHIIADKETLCIVEKGEQHKVYTVQGGNFLLNIGGDWAWFPMRYFKPV